MTDQTIEAALISELLASPEIAALVSDRIYPDFIPQPASGVEYLPAIAVSVDSEEAHESLDAAAKLWEAEFEVSCWAASKQVADQVAAAVRNAINGFVGTLGEHDNVKIDGLTLTRSLFISAGQAQRRAFRSAVAGTIWYTQEAPFQLNTTTG